MDRSWDIQLIIGMSTHSNMNDSGQGLQAGMNAFYPKPITAKTLTEILGRTEVTSRTRKLDEWESSMGQGNSADCEPSEHVLLPPSPAALAQAHVPVCLIAIDTSTTEPNPLPQQLESLGWNVVVATNASECLKLLQIRNWDAVLIDDDLPQMSGALCVEAFRRWEVQHRVIAQKNVFLVCEGDFPSHSNMHTWVQPPVGCDGRLRKPVPFNDLLYIVHASGVDCGIDIGVK